jgi:hypothetical protein
VHPDIAEVTITHKLFDNGVRAHLRFMATPIQRATLGGDWLEENGELRRRAADAYARRTHY